MVNPFYVDVAAKVERLRSIISDDHGDDGDFLALFPAGIELAEDSVLGSYRRQMESIIDSGRASEDVRAGLDDLSLPNAMLELYRITNHPTADLVEFFGRFTKDCWDAWGGEKGTLPCPVDEWKDEFKAPIDAYPGIDFLPVCVSYVYCSALRGEMDLYSRIHLEPHADDGGDAVTTILVGEVPDCDQMIFLFDTHHGSVLFLDLEAGIPELVNSSLKCFVEFLYRFAMFAEADEGIEGRAIRADDLYRELAQLDPSAFVESDSWWSMIFHELMSAAEV
ncbi:SUKH-4 family immunity protein [Nocardia sp. NPDC052566]|uniref:SUKH-4 family immunity protein n=1 Tax=Nocardia sp. NPDC052566 TaxID=3364330 RepID=UPI0037C9A504